MKNISLKLHHVVLSLFLAGLMSMVTNVAIGGEVDGKGNPIPGGANGSSECSFSGQQDNAEEDEGFFRGDRVQSWGQIPKAMRDILRMIGLHPGDACNPRKSGN